jgi:hypothetical protein
MADLVLNFDLKGIPEMQAKIAEALATMHVKAEGALFQISEEEMTKSKNRTPVDLGNLRSSGHVALPVTDAEGISVTMGFGGPAGIGNVGGETNKKDVGYAIIVHEDVRGVVPRAGGVGQSKFLESVLREDAPQLVERIANRIKL